MDRPVVAKGTEAEFREALDDPTQLPFVLTDGNGAIRLANRAAAELLGRSTAELIGHIGRYFLGPTEAVAISRNALVSGTVSSMRSELHISRPDGTTVPVWLSSGPESWADPWPRTSARTPDARSSSASRARRRRPRCPRISSIVAASSKV